MITVERLHELFDYDPQTGSLVRKVTTSQNARKGAIAGHMCSHGYLNVWVDGVRYKVHRLVWMYHRSKMPIGIIDHINRVRSDNRIENLREADAGINAINSGIRSDNTTGIKCVKWHSRDAVFQARCTRNKVVYNLGSFKSADAAGAAVSAFLLNREKAGA